MLRNAHFSRYYLFNEPNALFRERKLLLHENSNRSRRRVQGVDLEWWPCHLGRVKVARAGMRDSESTGLNAQR